MSDLSPQPEADEQNEQTGFVSGCLAVVGVLVSLLYLSNPTMGVIEFLPDAMPLVGNLDEVFFTGLLLASLARLGVRLPFKKKQQQQPLRIEDDTKTDDA